MAVEEQTEVRVRTVRPGLIGTGIGLVMEGLSWALGAWLLAIAIELAGILWVWPEQGAQHARSMLDFEIGYIDREVVRSLVTSEPARFAGDIVLWLRYWLFEATGLWPWLQQALSQPVQGFWAWCLEALLSAVYITEVFGVRLAILLLALPLFGITALAAIGEGLLARDLRRWDGGRESSYRYHLAKKAVKPAFIGPWVLYLSAPISVHPLLVLLPCVAVFGVAIAVMFGSFKKYF